VRVGVGHSAEGSAGGDDGTPARGIEARLLDRGLRQLLQRGGAMRRRGLRQRRRQDVRPAHDDPQVGDQPQERRLLRGVRQAGHRHEQARRHDSRVQDLPLRPEDSAPQQGLRLSHREGDAPFQSSTLTQPFKHLEQSTATTLGTLGSFLPPPPPPPSLRGTQWRRGEFQSRPKATLQRWIPSIGKFYVPWHEKRGASFFFFFFFIYLYNSGTRYC
jgi:hypothetical protein